MKAQTAFYVSYCKFLELSITSNHYNPNVHGWNIYLPHTNATLTDLLLCNHTALQHLPV